MTIIWKIFTVIAIAATAFIWIFLAGWAGRIPWTPDMQLLRDGEWFSWLSGMVVLYGPPSLAVFCFTKAVRDKS